MKLARLVVLTLIALNALSVYSQPKTINYELLKFEKPLQDSKYVKKMDRLDSLNNPDFFFIKHSYNYGRFSFIKRQGTIWLAYEMPRQGRRTEVGKIAMLSDDIVAVEMVTTYHDGFGREYCKTYFININTLRYFQLSNYYSEVHNDLGTGEPKILLECASTFSIEDNIFRITGTHPDRPDRAYCLESAEYRMGDTSMVQTKYFARIVEGIYPISCLENICTGIDTIELKRRLPKAILRKVPLYEYGYDSDELGVEVVQNNKVLFFACIPMEQVTSVCAVSANYNLHGLQTGMTVEEVMKKYPDSKLRTDLISDWEYIYLKEERIRLVFRTDETNRIGRYDADPEGDAISVTQLYATVDFIELN